jgi:hypothetical protein
MTSDVIAARGRSSELIAAARELTMAVAVALLAVSHSVPVATFGHGIDAIVVKRIHALGTTTPVAAPEGRSTT